MKWEEVAGNVDTSRTGTLYQISVHCLCFALESLPASSMLSHTLQKTENFSSRVRVSACSQSFMILSMYPLEVIMSFRDKGTNRKDHKCEDYLPTV